MHLEIVFTQILILSILIVVGIIGSKFGVISLMGKDMLAKLIFNITLPLMLLCNFSRINISPRLLNNSLSILAATFLTLLFMLLVSWFITIVIRMKKGDASIFKTHSVFGNIVYLGFPLISALYGEEGLLYAGMFQLVTNLMIWTVGVIILNQGKDLSLKQKLKHILNINTIAVLIGFIMFLLSIKLPMVLMKSLGNLGDSTAYLSMLYIGSMLYYTNLKGLLNKKEVYIFAFNKLILLPVIILLILSGVISLFPGKIDAVVISVLVLLSSMPGMANVVIMAKIFGADDKLATANVFVSTIACLLTLPVILLLIEAILSHH
jgi:predicted permease